MTVDYKIDALSGLMAIIKRIKCQCGYNSFSVANDSGLQICMLTRISTFISSFCVYLLIYHVSNDSSFSLNECRRSCAKRLP